MLRKLGVIDTLAATRRYSEGFQPRVLKNWVTDSDTVRMAIHTSVHTPTDQQSIIYTPSFTVEQ
jgi:hypothetical protein